MRIGFDISQVAHQGGVSVYTENLTRKLDLLSGLDMIYCYFSLRKPYRGNLKSVQKYMIPPSVFEVLFNRFRHIPIERFIGDIDVFHSSDWVQPKTFAKKITTYHDLVPVLYPQWSTPKIVSVANRRLKLVEEEIDEVIAVSKSVKEDLLKHTRIPDEKITVIYEGVEEFFYERSEKDVEEFKRKHKLPEKFVLAISGVGERRNIQRIKEASGGYDLVITGKDLFVERQELPLLYSAASGLVYASLYEGFGLPIIEAFACGCPVITSNVSSMPEIAGDAAIKVDPLKVADIEKAIRVIMEDGDMVSKLIQKGKKRSADFSWDIASEQTKDVYLKLKGLDK